MNMNTILGEAEYRLASDLYHKASCKIIQEMPLFSQLEGILIN